jgi:hypothetical protein
MADLGWSSVVDLRSSDVVAEVLGILDSAEDLAAATLSVRKRAEELLREAENALRRLL